MQWVRGLRQSERLLQRLRVNNLNCTHKIDEKIHTICILAQK